MDLSPPDLKRRSPSSPLREHNVFTDEMSIALLHHVPGLDWPRVVGQD
jgi:hypothetical protein